MGDIDIAQLREVLAALSEFKVQSARLGDMVFNFEKPAPQPFTSANTTPSTEQTNSPPGYNALFPQGFPKFPVTGG